MTAKPSLWTRVKHAVFGGPLTHEQASARHDVDVAAARAAASAENDARARSVQIQTHWGL